MGKACNQGNLLLGGHASQVAERSLVIDTGEIIFEGLPLEVLENEDLLKLLGK